MDVKVLGSTDNAEKLMCAAARGDYMDDWNAEKSFADIMSTVSYDDNHFERAVDKNRYPDESRETEAKMVAFIEKQLSRGHYGPAEHPQITFSVKGVSRVTMAQITRHRHMTFDVQSQRYVDFSDVDAVVPKSLVDSDHFSREDGILEVNEETQEMWEQEYRLHTERALDLYEDMVADGIPKEDARFVLPLGTPVNMTFSGNARTFMHLLDMRKKANAQWEIRELSEKIIEELKDWMPYTYNHYERKAPHKLSP